MPDYEKVLNPAQLAAVTAPDGHTLVVAGAGTGKTRTIVYRLAWLMEQGLSPEAILLLTFTRKAAKEMLFRAESLLGYSLGKLSGGTFHAFAHSVLRVCKPAWLEGRPFTLMDAADITQAIRTCRENLKVGKKDHSFPKNQTIAGILSKARNKEIPVSEILRQENFHLLPHAQAIEDIGFAYVGFRRERALLDYDDLLFELEDLLHSNAHLRFNLQSRFRHILVDEYQDTNLVQARLVQLLAQPPGGNLPAPSVMAVGDEAQSIYAFRGANVRNILDFKKYFPDAKTIPLEQNYRSTQPILNIANDILAHAAESWHKELFTQKDGGSLPRLVRPRSDLAEADIVTNRIQELLRTHSPHEIAVLFRSGFHSYAMETALRSAGIPFRKYGGLRFVEAAHIKDLLAYGRLAINPIDEQAFARIAAMHKGVGPKTIAKMYAAIVKNDPESIKKEFRKFPELLEELANIKNLSAEPPVPFFEKMLDTYRPHLEALYPDDWPARLPGIEEVLHLAEQWDSLDLFIADVALESPEEEVDEDAEMCITLSTVHSAKGLEWRSVIILDAVEDRFPSRHAQARPEDFEEERRLFYVACTRARENLEIYAPRMIHNRDGVYPVNLSPFVAELSSALLTDASGSQEPAPPPNTFPNAPPKTGTSLPGAGGHCRHKIFGRGKIVARLDNDMVRVNFPAYGEKTILASYLIPEE